MMESALYQTQFKKTGRLVITLTLAIKQSANAGEDGDNELSSKKSKVRKVGGKHPTDKPWFLLLHISNLQHLLSNSLNVLFLVN